MLFFETALQPRPAATRLTNSFRNAVNPRWLPDDSCLFSVSSDWPLPLCPSPWGPGCLRHVRFHLRAARIASWHHIALRAPHH
ncbi:hypothetical protein CCHR01_15068 [Colletotrichum chrysophilum]|uniref:Uncharacterized protein n=1 Tax=Colletotrichum chrysophilum TaxID=1836956 RepID=A0AAD9A6C6_9PEZI|nr:hypothetical protein CCHR01_15068 [Colletotrichum chrysophilum]